MKLTGKKLKAKDLIFYVEDNHGRSQCGTCGKRTTHCGVAVELEMPLEETQYGLEALCPECLTSTPKRIAELARERAANIEGMRPARGEDSDKNVRTAIDLRRVANVLDTLSSIDEIHNGILARKIGEAFIEEMNRPKRTSGKAA